jgi:bacterioferritin
MTPKILTDLNGDLSREYAATVQYVQHYGCLTGPEYMTVREQLKEHAKEELDHALKLSDLIQYYGGKPTGLLTPVSPPAGPQRILQTNLTSEDMQIARYRVRIKELEAEGDYEMATVIRNILEDELDHANDLKLALGK